MARTSSVASRDRKSKISGQPAKLETKATARRSYQGKAPRHVLERKKKRDATLAKATQSPGGKALKRDVEPAKINDEPEAGGAVTANFWIRRDSR